MGCNPCATADQGCALVAQGVQLLFPYTARRVAEVADGCAPRQRNTDAEETETND